ncbi:MAG: hypothetical protein QXN29_05155 [Thermofilaceae archaeon]
MARVFSEYAAYLPGERVVLRVESGRGGKLLLKRGGELVASWEVKPGRDVFEFSVAEEGLYEATLEPEGAHSMFAVLTRQDPPPMLAVVFHNHQAPNYSPDGAVREPWAYKHVWEDEFAPYYDGGAYLVQARLLEKWGVRWNANLSPSLLHQWARLLERGAVISQDGAYLCVEPDSWRSRRVAESLEIFKRLARNQLEVLTSFYSHPIAGYIAEVYGWADLLKEELRLGKEITERVLEVEPLGAWLPEMSFSMRLVPILIEHGIRYTVLDALNHFSGAVGDKGGIYEPYSLGELVIFFRHTGLSDLWSFKYSNVPSPEAAEVAARDFTLRLVLEAYTNKAKPLTVALDGENWMILPHPKPPAAVFFDRMLEQLRAAVDRGLIRLVKLSEVLEEVEPRRLISVPARSWMGGYAKWTSEKRQEQEKIWANIIEAYEVYKALENSVGAGEEDLLALFHAVNSDHIWAEFADEGFSREWLEYLRSRLATILSSIKLEGFADSKLKIRNALDREVKVLVTENGHATEVTLPPGVSEIPVQGSVVEISIKGWTSVFRLGKPLVRERRSSD